MAGGRKVVLWVALGCGGVLFLGFATCLGVGWYAKKKLTAEIAKENPGLAQAIAKGGVTGAIKGGAGQMVAVGASLYGSVMLAGALPKEEQKAAQEVMQRLAKVGAQFTPEDIEAVTKAMEAVQKPHEADKSLPTADEARTFLEAVQPIAEKYQPQ